MENDNERNQTRVMTRKPTRFRLVKKVGSVNILEVTGRLAPGDANDELCKKIDQYIATGEQDFLLDLSGVSYISSTGVGSLIQSYHHIERAGGHLKLFRPSQCVSHIISVSRLDSIFEVFDDEMKAIQSFQTPSPATDPGGEKKVRVRKIRETS